MHKLLALLCLSAIVCVSACQQHNNGDLPETKKPAPLVPPDATGLKNPKFGISTPNVEHDFTVAAGQPLILKGWYAADQALNVTYELNGRKSAARSETRDDVKKHFPDFKYVQGWLVFIPANRLQAANDLVIHYGDKSWPIAVSVK